MTPPPRSLPADTLEDLRPQLASLQAALDDQQRELHRLQRREAAHAALATVAARLPLLVVELAVDVHGGMHWRYLNEERVPDIVGLPAQALLQEPATLWQHLHPDDAGPVREALQQAHRQARSGTAAPPLRLTARLVQGDALRWLQLDATPWLDGDDGTLVWTGTVQDISATMLERERLMASETYGTMLFRQSQRAMVVFDPELPGFIDCNDAAVKIYGHKRREDVIGKTP